MTLKKDLSGFYWPVFSRAARKARRDWLQSQEAKAREAALGSLVDIEVM